MSNDRKKFFSGISFDLFNLRLNRFDGYGLTLCCIGWHIVDRITMSYSKSLFTIYFKIDKSNEGRVLKFKASLFFYRFKEVTLKVWIPPKTVCKYCYEYCEVVLEHNSHSYCSQDCIEYDTE